MHPARPLALSLLALLLAACAPLEQLRDLQSSSSSALNTESASEPELQPEIEEVSASPPAPAGTSEIAGHMVERGILELGIPDAPLILTVFTNLSCGYCREFARDMLPRLESEFIAKGLLAVRPVITPLKKYPNSALEAAALICGNVLGKGWELWDALNAAASRDRTAILSVGKKLGIPAKDFTRCIDARETQALLAQQRDFIAANGVTLIPTFLLNGQKQIGLPSFAELRGWIREALAARPTVR